ncbi:hypothetical protein JCM3770_002999 [Rhodotorula araucariae]
MAAPPLALTYVAPALQLPAWLSYISAPTATILAPYTLATLLPNGVPTLLTGVVAVTQYETAILQLPLTVDSAANVQGQVLGSLYTTAGGTVPVTVLNEFGGTRRFTIGRASETRALAGTAVTPMTALTTAAATAPRRTRTGDNSPSPAALTGEQHFALAITRLTSGVPVPHAELSSASSVAVGLMSALESATNAATPNPQAISSLSIAVDSAASVLASASAAATLSTDSAASPVSSPNPSSPSPPPSSSIRLTTSSSTSASSSIAATYNTSQSLTPSQLAAAIAAPICFFFLVLAVLLLCCCCIRRRRRRRAERRISEEEGLLDGPVRPAAPKEHARGVLWEWVPHRRASDGGRSRASGRSALSRLTGGLLGRRGTRSGASAAASTPRSSPRDGPEKGFVGEGEKPALGSSGASRQYGPPGDGDIGDGVGPSTPLLGAEPEQSSSPAGSPRSPPRSPRSPLRLLRDSGEHAGVRYAAFPAASSSAPAFEDVDLTSPRPGADVDGFDAPPRVREETTARPAPLPILPSIAPQEGPLRLSTLYDPYFTTALPPSPASYETPSTALTAPAPMVERPCNRYSASAAATSSLSELWHGYETSSPQTDAGGSMLGTGDKRDSRPGYLSWLNGAYPDAGTAAEAHAPQQEYTPPQTPEAVAGLKVIVEDEDSPLVGSNASSSRRTGGSGAPGSAWMNGTGMWGVRRGSRDSRSAEGSDEVERSSPPPFSSFEPISTSSISYEPPVFLHGAPAPSTYGAHPLPRHSASFTTDSMSRYDDASSPAQSALPLDSPLVYTPPRFSVVYPARGRAARQRSVESGLSVLDRIAASFGSVKEGLSAGLGVDFGEGGLGRRSGERLREMSTESMTDPFQHDFQPFQPRLPPLPSPANTPPHRRSLLSLHRRSSQSLRRARSQPHFDHSFGGVGVPPIPEASPVSAGEDARWVDPFKEDEPVMAHPYTHEDEEGHGVQTEQRWTSAPNLARFPRVEGDA